MYLADRTTIWDKEQKQYDPWVVGGWMVFSLALGLATVKKADKDLGFLNREQTDEWKGWMQSTFYQYDKTCHSESFIVAILIYHYYGASKISGIYNPIRVLVAAYLFMTGARTFQDCILVLTLMPGYGHTTFYVKKADFGLLRVAQVLVRLNLLPVTLAYVMDTDYISYYFSPLVSMWFLIIYATMAIGKGYNENMTFLVAKICLSMALITVFMSYDWLLAEVFLWLERLCGIHWSAKEWAFRVKLDLWIVYFGMLTSLAYMKFREARFMDSPHWPFVYKVSLGLSGVTFLWYFGFELSQPTKFDYNAWHPYISILPIGAFVILRNANPILRSANSKVFAFIGTCSLETFIIQFHFWLAADTKGILLLIPGTRWRWINVVVSTIVFIWISNKVAKATGDLTNWICGTTKKTLPTTRSLLPLQPSSSTQSTQPEEIPLTSGKDEEPNADLATPPQRWVDRLANGTQGSRPGFRMFMGDGSSWSTSWTPSLGMKLGIAGVVMWFVNMTWSH